MVIGNVLSVTSHPTGGIDAAVDIPDQTASVSTTSPGKNALSGLGRAPSRAAARARADASAQSQQADAPGLLQQVGTYGGPLVDGAASGLSLAAAQLSASQQQPAKLTGIVSGALWAAGAAISQCGNVPANSLVSSANAVGAAAGVLSALATSMTGSDSSRVAYASASAWALNGGANLVRAATDTASVLPSRVLQGVSGAANIAAAGLAAAATAAAEKDAPVEAVNLGTASSVLWGVGAVAALGSAWMAGQREAPSAAIESPDHVPVPPSHS
ncbi:hypothetical protein [Xanthomonas vasicola]|uniref:hypothetical protein n=1 Tax=Xanthomonas vasicola TaxID=56459 RepID=UPI0003473438|nr:hypothetical protein [Xanthomonas vasicola]MDO6934198.1 hypothetical protein [Xanthomonas vasicola]MDO6937653.1 hypothetical protein [Xanthomonas vasicola]MDO6947624.1 hypothetical protein [Xanthomonas vasicola]MDO6959792.1 hypothetical protein [Xanthomonas vasicola]MDO6968869.1 hypothetical protein [Xanthomonas vasicola]